VLDESLMGCGSHVSLDSRTGKYIQVYSDRWEVTLVQSILVTPVKEKTFSLYLVCSGATGVEVLSLTYGPYVSARYTLGNIQSTTICLPRTWPLVSVTRTAIAANTIPSDYWSQGA
jgi:hypothetical protein